MFSRIHKFGLCAALSFLMLGASNVGAAKEKVGGSKTLIGVQKNGVLHCGTRSGTLVVGIDPDGFNSSGYQRAGAQWCRGLAAAISVDVEIIPLTVAEVYPALAGRGPKEKQVDVSFRSLFERAGRDIQNEIDYVGPIFHDSFVFMTDDPGFIVSGDLTKSVAEQVAHINNNVLLVCVRDGTAQVGLALESGVLPSLLLQQTTDAEGWDSPAPGGEFCDVILHTEVVLADLLRQGSKGTPLLTSTMSTQVHESDPKWRDLIKYYVGGMKLAVVEGVSISNVIALSAGPVENLTLPSKHLLGLSVNVNGDTTGDLMGLDADWMVRAIAEVGNYNEIFYYGFQFHPAGPNQVNSGMRGLMRALDLNPAP